jgi:DNA polymerase
MVTQLPKDRRLEILADQVRVCVKCPLHASRILAVPGEGRPFAPVMLIGEAPGREEDKCGRPFVGASGQFLNEVLDGTGIDRADLFITNIVKCRPPNNRTPKRAEVETCTDNYLFEQIRLINPRLIILLGAVAVKRVLGIARVNEVRGRVLQQDGRKYFVTYHPAVRFYREDLGQKLAEDFARLKEELKEL